MGTPPRVAGVFPRHTKRHCPPHPPRLTRHPRVPVPCRDDPSHPLPPRAFCKQRYERPSYGGLWPCVVHFRAYSACVFGQWQSPWRRRRYPQSHQGRRRRRRQQSAGVCAGGRKMHARQWEGRSWPDSDPCEHPYQCRRQKRPSPWRRQRCSLKNSDVR